MKIEMVDLRKQYLAIKGEIDAKIQGVIDSAAFIQGVEVKEFAHALAKYLDARFVVPCGNGTDALQIAMMALDLKPGDEVILPVHTYVATAEVIALLGLTPVFVDVNSASFTIDPAAITEKITPKTKAIVPVHLYGQCAHMEPILEVAEKHSLHVIEDAAQSLGADYIFSDGSRRKAGTLGVIGCTSFFPSKNLGCYGDGGALIVNDADLAEKIRMIANHGQKIKYHHDIVGVNSRLDTIQAAILNVKLNYLNQYNQKRNHVADFYDKQLSGIPAIQTPVRVPYATHVFHQYTLTIKNGQRNQLKEYLAERNIPTMIYYPVPLHHQKAYRVAQQVEAFPVTEALSESVISIPIHTEMTTDQLDYIVTAIRDFF